MRKRTKNLRNPINKLRFIKFLKKAETDQKKRKRIKNLRKPIKNMGKQINFKVLEKSGNGSKI